MDMSDLSQSKIILIFGLKKLKFLASIMRLRCYWLGMFSFLHNVLSLFLLSPASA
jgi:hypothetical protein